ncbi:hypothetical protein [Brevibacillus brevis]|uniref:hypothetical protein n=1 Tax=Brevibacillus brevis TaxID=1393 RepID=UPI0019017E83|nr:hypothetical protein [Brevibacillus brevis]
MKKILSAVIATSILAVYSGGTYASAKTDSSVSLQVNENKPTQIIIPKEFFDPNHPKAIKDPETIKKFEKILKEIEAKDKTLVSSVDKPQKTPAIAVYFVPGIGQVALVATGVVLIGTALYYAGDWLYDCVDSWLNAETADEYISKNRKGSIRREFPSEYLDRTLNEIEKDAKNGERKARTAKKLLNDNRFKKD